MMQFAEDLEKIVAWALVKLSPHGTSSKSLVLLMLDDNQTDAVCSDEKDAQKMGTIVKMIEAAQCTR